MLRSACGNRGERSGICSPKNYAWIPGIPITSYSQLQMSADKSWDSGAVFFRVSTLHAPLNPCSRQRESRAAVPTLVCGHLELTIRNTTGKAGGHRLGYSL
ncbi:hypothetical protein Y032_0253g276 [Ancylostoma ceylanicum]|uniref:Uncharacterized protein n=1 Tax=Ancylostoma ceylanicum TaxID=53326 RepID=A0A016SBN9_9BILA|nr:hypothetical protein Y032_0253g276 [Ancylostoma ceylanicum]